MLDPAVLRDDPDRVKSALQNRGLEPDALLAELGTVDERRRALIVDVETLKRAQNASGEEVARLKRLGEDASGVFDANRQRGQRIKALDAELQTFEEQRTAVLQTIPNLPHASVPVGRDASHNAEVRRVGDPPSFDFAPKPHWDLGTALGILDFERAAKIARARFAFLLGAGARLSRALIDFMLDVHTREHGYREVEPPFMVNAASLLGTGNLPKFEADLFKIAGEWDLFLVPTAEVPLTNMFRGEILDAPVVLMASRVLPGLGEREVTEGTEAAVHAPGL